MTATLTEGASMREGHCRAATTRYCRLASDMTSHKGLGQSACVCPTGFDLTAGASIREGHCRAATTRYCRLASDMTSHKGLGQSACVWPTGFDLTAGASIRDLRGSATNCK